MHIHSLSIKFFSDVTFVFHAAVYSLSKKDWGCWSSSQVLFRCSKIPKLHVPCLCGLCNDGLLSWQESRGPPFFFSVKFSCLARDSTYKMVSILVVGLCILQNYCLIIINIIYKIEKTKLFYLLVIITCNLYYSKHNWSCLLAVNMVVKKIDELH